MTQRHKFGVRGQGGRGGRLIKVGGHFKTKENIAGPGSKLNCKTEQKEFSCYLRTACLLEKKKILRWMIKVQGKGRKYVRHEESHICFLSRFLILEGNMCSHFWELAAGCTVKNHPPLVSVNSPSCHHSLPSGSLALGILGEYDKTMERVYIENVYMPSQKTLHSIQGVHKRKTLSLTFKGKRKLLIKRKHFPKDHETTSFLVPKVGLGHNSSIHIC